MRVWVKVVYDWVDGNPGFPDRKVIDRCEVFNYPVPNSYETELQVRDKDETD